jgi:U6 snRNA-associated Sm-like protein LSm6
MSAPAAAANGATDAKDPSGFLSEIIGAPVTVKLNSGVVYKGEQNLTSEAEMKRKLMVFVGELQSVDGYMNIALEQTREFVDGKQRRTYGDAFVRGNNGPSTWSSIARRHY